MSKMKRNNFYQPAINIKKAEDQFIIELALAGWKRDEIELKIEEGKMHVIGTPVKNENSVEDTGTYKMRSFVKSEFKRSFVLNNNLDVDQISAQMHDGILSVNVPQKVKQVQKVEIK